MKLMLAKGVGRIRLLRQNQGRNLLQEENIPLIRDPLLELIANASFIIGADCQCLPKGGQWYQSLCGEEEEGRALHPCLAYFFLYADILSGNHLIFRLPLRAILRKAVDMQVQDTCKVPLGVCFFTSGHPHCILSTFIEVSWVLPI